MAQILKSGMEDIYASQYETHADTVIEAESKEKSVSLKYNVSLGI
jgi:hypothetical protein